MKLHILEEVYFSHISPYIHPNMQKA